MSSDKREFFSGLVTCAVIWYNSIVKDGDNMEPKDRIRMSREKAGLTQEEVAKHLNTIKQTIWKYENGVVTNIPLDKLQRMAELFDVDPAYLAGWSNTPNRNDSTNEVVNSLYNSIGAINEDGSINQEVIRTFDEFCRVFNKHFKGSDKES